MNKNKLSLIQIFFFVSCVIWAQEGTTNKTEGNEILKKADENLMPASFESYRKLINEEPDGSKKEFIFFTVKKRQRQSSHVIHLTGQ